MSTLMLILVFVFLVVGPWVAWACFLWLGLKWAKAEKVSLARVLAVTGAAILINIALTTLFISLMFAPSAIVFPLGLFLVALMFLLPILVIRRLFQLTTWRSVQAFLPTLFAPALCLVINATAIRPFVLEAFATTANSMAPTLLGSHWRGTCPQCQSPMYCSPREPAELRFEDEPDPLMICKNFHTSQQERGSESDDTVHYADRFVVTKLQAPQRWDIVAFRYPAAPQQTYVMRLVGLPGETIVIKDDGSVFADEIRLTPPTELQNIRYESEIPGAFGPHWGTADRPAELGENEFFVLGDFSANAADSRYWNDGAPGHSPYAVPRSHIVGVATHIYWPPARWRSFP